MDRCLLHAPVGSAQFHINWSNPYKAFRMLITILRLSSPNFLSGMIKSKIAQRYTSSSTSTNFVTRGENHEFC